MFSSVPLTLGMFYVGTFQPVRCYRSDAWALERFQSPLIITSIDWQLLFASSQVVIGLCDTMHCCSSFWYNCAHVHPKIFSVNKLVLLNSYIQVTTMSLLWVCSSIQQSEDRQDVFRIKASQHTDSFFLACWMCKMCSIMFVLWCHKIIPPLSMHPTCYQHSMNLFLRAKVKVA